MDRPNDGTEPKIVDAVPYRTPVDVSDDATPGPKKFPWLVTSVVAAAIIGLVVVALFGVSKTKQFGITRGGPPPQIRDFEDVDIKSHVEDFGLQCQAVIEDNPDYDGAAFQNVDPPSSDSPQP